MELSQILRHPLFPFADFRTSDASFLMLELYWAALAREALGEEVPALAVPLQATDRDTEYWGDPLMIDFWIPGQRRGAKVMLAESTEGLPACRDMKPSWTSTTFRSSSGNGPRTCTLRCPAAKMWWQVRSIVRFSGLSPVSSARRFSVSP